MRSALTSVRNLENNHNFPAHLEFVHEIVAGDVADADGDDKDEKERKKGGHVGRDLFNRATCHGAPSVPRIVASASEQPSWTQRPSEAKANPCEQPG